MLPQCIFYGGKREDQGGEGEFRVKFKVKTAFSILKPPGRDRVGKLSPKLLNEGAYQYMICMDCIAFYLKRTKNVFCPDLVVNF